MGISDLPVVFDLPPSLAVKRADEFTRYVHPVLQVYCARCHNESYDGDFRLVQFRTKVDRTKDALRANLDATLKLIDRENPPRSELLASSLRPHGRAPNVRPIFQGSNDRAYQVLATWVNKLKATSFAQSATPAKANHVAVGDEPAEPFASQRGRAAEGTEQVGSSPRPFVTGPVTNKFLPPSRAVPGKGMIPETSVDPNEFPLPFAVSGVKAKIGNEPSATQAPATNHVQPGGSADSHHSGAVLAAKAAATPVRMNRDTSDLRKAAAEAGGDPKSSSSDTSDRGDTVPEKKKPRKPIKLDPAILQRALQQRNQGQ